MSDENFLWTTRLKEQKNGTISCFVRQQEFTIGEALSFDSEYEGVTALEHVIGAIGSDILNVLRKLSKKKRIEVFELEGLIECELDNPLVFLQVVGEEGNTAIKKIQLKVFISSFEKPDLVEQLWQEALRISPLANTFKNSVDFRYEYKLVL